MANHSAAAAEAVLPELPDDMVEFPDDQSPLRACCMTIDPSGASIPSAAGYVVAIARHAEVEITLAIYAHTDMDAMREALDSIEWDEL